mmetsp:Transcript_142950/g.456785  ORF Transcript_142950/g.456785 Transcript_142950/m.456785 type:complete len:313 (-) Transcript_142950:275-1213(-)
MSRCLDVEAAEDQQPLMEPSEVPSASGARFLRPVLALGVGGCVAVLGSVAFFSQAPPSAVAPKPALDILRQFAEAYGQVSNAAASAVESTREGCELAKDAAKLCIDEENFAGDSANACDKECLGFLLEIEANCPASDHAVLKGKATLELCKDSDPVPPNLEEEEPTDGAQVTACGSAIAEIAKACDISHFIPPEVDNLCTSTCVSTLKRTKDVCLGKDAELAKAMGIPFLVSACDGCGNGLMKMQSEPIKQACSLNQPDPQSWKPCDAGCHDFACDLKEKCVTSSLDTALFPPDVVQGIKTMTGDSMNACSC